MVDLWAALPFAAMVAVECLDVGLTTLSKAAMSRGMSHFIFVLYSNALAALILVPLSSFQRKKRPPLTLPLLCRFFFLGLTGITIMQNCVFTGISYSSPTLGSAMSNLIPAFTFILAIIFRLEKLDIRSSRSQAKLVGTLVSISGALVVTLYKGPSIWSSSHSLPLHHRQQSPPNSLKAENWVLGALFLATACLSASIWNIIQPLGIAIAAIMGAIFLGDTLYVGSVIGALIIALGFYCVILGQSQEQFNENYKGIDGLESSSAQRNPLLE
ncbi:hypothetical protein MRB53_005516 [Persea americana]|uniref:Uncharacterized protein n=1 Tax=Persea americana TaxID=3435 RepID=A0ACC2MEE4_PERAE|nr:hypothetical protein MRB53_005516 [Persea americana]